MQSTIATCDKNAVTPSCVNVVVVLELRMAIQQIEVYEG